MLNSKPDQTRSTHRQWRAGEQTKSSIFQAFRAAHHAGDARHERARADDGITELTTVRKQRRFGISEDELRRHLEADLAALLNTTHMEALVDLSDTPNVAKSIVNYGFRDLSSLGAAELGSPDVVNSLRQSLLDFEPRLIPETVEVTIRDTAVDSKHHLALVVSAELVGDPVDIPLDFDADVDLGAGKLKLSELKVHK